MVKKYLCGCGYNTEEINDFRRHLLKEGAKAKGRHFSVTEKKINELAEERLKSFTPEPAPAPAKTSGIGANRPSGRKWLMMGLGALLSITGCGITAFGNSGRISILIVLGLVIIASGVIVAIRAFRSEGSGLFGGKSGVVPSDSVIPKAKGTENCLNIYPHGVFFEYMSEPKGIPRKCENDNGWYYVNIWDKHKGELTPLLLPDTRFFDPKEFANIVEAEPWKRFFEIRFPTLEKIAVWAFLGVIGLMILAIMILPGALKGD